MRKRGKIMHTTEKTKKRILVGMFAAVLAVLAPMSLPMPSGVPVTLQTFAVALTGFVLGWKLGTAATFIYILMGAIGLPVYAGMTSGFGEILGVTGGFLYGFLFMAAFCGLGGQQKNRIVGVLLGLVGLGVCHLFGILQFALLMKLPFGAAALMASVPYLLKDAVSVAAAMAIAEILRRALSAAGMVSYECT